MGWLGHWVIKSRCWRKTSSVWSMMVSKTLREHLQGLLPESLLVIYSFFLYGPGVAFATNRSIGPLFLSSSSPLQWIWEAHCSMADGDNSCSLIWWGELAPAEYNWCPCWIPELWEGWVCGTISSCCARNKKRLLLAIGSRISSHVLTDFSL